MEGAMSGRKRAFDVILAVPLLIIFSPLFVVSSMLVAMDGGPVIYGHKRVGHAGRTFPCYKFRTMIMDAPDILDEYLALHPTAAVEWQQCQKLDTDPRITGIGQLLRRTSLDEVPQLLNVIRGEMSLVGPRPVTETELSRYGEHASSYMAARPGMTGLWQVSGRNRLSYAERVALDMEYLRTQSLWRDFVILFKTVKVLIIGDGK
jgi:exopolysaccharide production protein ExoY